MAAEVPEPVIRLAKPSELRVIREIASKTWPETYAAIISEEQISYMLETMYSIKALRKQAEEGIQFLIANFNHLPGGFAAYSSASISGIYRIQKLYVLPQLQRKGFGKKMIDFMMKEAKKNGATSLQLNVNRVNNARIFYEKLGFKVLREEDIDIGHHYFMNDFVMEKLI